MQSEITNMEYKVLMFNIATVVAIILVLATLSCNQDGWKMREGIYVWFITFTTVGFGDLIPAKMTGWAQPHAFIIPGLCLMSGVVDALVECAAAFQTDNCRGKVFQCLFCHTLCGSCHADTAAENIASRGSTHVISEATNGSPQVTENLH